MRGHRDYEGDANPLLGQGCVRMDRGCRGGEFLVQNVRPGRG